MSWITAPGGGSARAYRKIGVPPVASVEHHDGVAGPAWSVTVRGDLLATRYHRMADAQRAAEQLLLKLDRERRRRW